MLAVIDKKAIRFNSREEDLAFKTNMKYDDIDVAAIKKIMLTVDLYCDVMKGIYNRYFYDETTFTTHDIMILFRIFAAVYHNVDFTDQLFYSPEFPYLVYFKSEYNIRKTSSQQLDIVSSPITKNKTTASFFRAPDRSGNTRPGEIGNRSSNSIEHFFFDHYKIKSRSASTPDVNKTDHYTMPTHEPIYSSTYALTEYSEGSSVINVEHNTNRLQIIDEQPTNKELEAYFYDPRVQISYLLSRKAVQKYRRNIVNIVRKQAYITYILEVISYQVSFKNYLDLQYTLLQMSQSAAGYRDVQNNTVSLWNYNKILIHTVLRSLQSMKRTVYYAVEYYNARYHVLRKQIRAQTANLQAYREANALLLARIKLVCMNSLRIGIVLGWCWKVSRAYALTASLDIGRPPAVGLLQDNSSTSQWSVQRQSESSFWDEAGINENQGNSIGVTEDVEL